MKFPRASGILLHPTSLPGKYGIGDLGPEAYAFVDFLVEAGQTYWQILPLGPTGYGDSPYNCYSAFAGNTLMISPEKLADDGLLSGGEASVGSPHVSKGFASDRVDFCAVYESKSEMLQLAFAAFERLEHGKLHDEIAKFDGENGWWLNDYAAFRAIKASRGQKPWYEWPTPLKLREKGAMAAITDELFNEIQAEKFFQFLFFRQWFALKEYANELGVKIIGDVPIFVALDSADVWCNQSKFKLNNDGSPKVVSGVPPDYFSSTGQLWGNPIYDWDAMRGDGFSWWTARVASALRIADVVRLDHFRGFAAAWEVPGKDKTAENGNWVDALGKELFHVLKRVLGDLPVIAEDLGVITPDVTEIRDEFGIPGMKILQFAFGGDAKNHDLPHNYPQNCVAYTGTHDNDTTVGWWNSQVGAESTRNEAEISREHYFCMKYLDTDGSKIHWDFIRAVWASVADTAIAPLQDVLGIGAKGRMNLPASTSDNWNWRFQKEDLTEEIIIRLSELTAIYGRNILA
jgi:4-alpha-glucanotransferase